LVAVSVTVWFGMSEYHGAFVIVAIAALILMVTTGVLINLMRNDKLEDKAKYAALAQALAMVILSASLIAVIFGPTPAPTYRLVGSIVGYPGSGLVVGSNDGQNLTAFPNSNPAGTFTFKNKFPDGFKWVISIKQQPQSAVCTVNTATGLFKGDDNLDARISCIVQYTIGGSVSGLNRSPVVLAQSSTRDTVEVASNGPFQFPTAVAPGTAYTVTVQTQPTDANCVVARGTGEANGPVETISVTCT